MKVVSIAFILSRLDEKMWTILAVKFWERPEKPTVLMHVSADSAMTSTVMTTSLKSICQATTPGKRRMQSRNNSHFHLQFLLYWAIINTKPICLQHQNIMTNQNIGWQSKSSLVSKWKEGKLTGIKDSAKVSKSFWSSLDSKFNRWHAWSTQASTPG